MDILIDNQIVLKKPIARAIIIKLAFGCRVVKRNIFIEVRLTGFVKIQHIIHS